MTAYVSAATGDWTTTTNWTPNGDPGTGDTVEINGHNIATNGDVEAKTITVKGDGKLIIEGNITFDDAAGAGLIIEDDGNLDNDASFGNSHILKSASVVPTYPFHIDVEELDDVDERTLDFTFLRFRGHHPYLGNSSYEIDFNGSNDDDPIVLTENPPPDESNLEEHTILRRSRGRVYNNGGFARALTITGIVTKASMLQDQLKLMKRSLARFAYIGMNNHMPKAYIERYDFLEETGSFQNFMITLRESE